VTLRFFFKVVCISWTIKVFDIIDARYNREDCSLVCFSHENLDWR